jgi:hypothetical protein
LVALEAFDAAVTKQGGVRRPLCVDSSCCSLI